VRERKLKYRWARTWQDRRDDYTAWDGDSCIGRVQLHNTGPVKTWTWHMGSEDGLSIHPANGADLDKMEACRQLEAAYDAARTKKDPG
jgi:hypothetical protein